MKKLWIITLLAALLLTACTAPDTEKPNDETNADEAATTEAPDTAPAINYDLYDLDGAFGFSYELLEGTFAPGETIRLRVSMLNRLPFAYEWEGASTDYRPQVELVSEFDSSYVLHNEPLNCTDEIAHYSVPAGDIRSEDYYTFTSPADAPIGTYRLVCRFRNTCQIFESAFAAHGREIYNHEDSFGFTYNGMEGTAARNQKIRVDVVLTNRMDCDYEWFGSSGGFGADAYLVSAVNPAYKISHLDMPIPDDSGYHKVAPGAARSREFEFTIPDDAPAGAYNLVCQFRHSQQTFKGVFELE